MIIVAMVAATGIMMAYPTTQIAIATAMVCRIVTIAVPTTAIAINLFLSLMGPLWRAFLF
jgi:hypothetical protein